MAIDPTVRRRQLGYQLRQLRDLKGLTAEQVAEAVPHWSATKISRAENAQVAVKVDHLVELLAFYDAEEALTSALVGMAKNGSRRGWWQSFTDEVTPLAADLFSLEADASTIQTYENNLIPGLLQTHDYAREIISGLQAQPEVNVDARVDSRMNRQAILTRKNNPVKFWAVIHEAAICSGVGGPAVMVPQLDRLLERSRLLNVHIQVMPTDAATHPGMCGPFTYLGFPQDRALDLVHVETLVDALWVEKPADVELYHAMFTRITVEAMTVEKSLELITKQRDRLTS
ncbi:helix-turn-helix domain-containing protein [Kitasatospora sp. NPDC058063]|uniref:helix-turn-helix domain-containing protein n=1 Tax=unclassified Kitasatospora TaxID=2633591 RepID=UPI0036DF5B40